MRVVVVMRQGCDPKTFTIEDALSVLPPQSITNCYQISTLKGDIYLNPADVISVHVENR